MAVFEAVSAVVVALPLVGAAWFGFRARKANQRAKARIAASGKSALDQLRESDQRD